MSYIGTHLRNLIAGPAHHEVEEQGADTDDKEHE